MKKGNNMNTRTNSMCLVTGSSLLVFMAALLFVTTLLFILGVPVSGYHLLPAAGATIWFILYASKARGLAAKEWIGKIVGTIVALVLVGLFLGGSLYDLSYDGQTYQQEGVIALEQGWNPVYEQLEGTKAKWLNHYAKGPWIYAAVLYKATGLIEYSKVFNLLLIFASFAICLAALLTFQPKRRWLSVLLALLAACNPVSLCQAFSFYADGQLASLIVILLALGYLLYVKADTLLYGLFGAALMLLINIKFTASGYAVLMSGGLFGFFLLFRRSECKRLFAVLAVSLLISFCLVGFNPYVMNTVSKGHPFYPLAGSHAVDIMTSNSPAHFPEMNRLEKLFYGVFSESANIAQPNSPKLKWPFTFHMAEMVPFSTTDTRIGGFGPLFGGAVVLTVVILALAALSSWTNAAKALGVIAVMLVTVLINPEAWWARYTPQLWLVPLLAVLIGFFAVRTRLAGFASMLLLIVLTVNLGIVSTAYVIAQPAGTQFLKGQLNSLKQQDQPVEVKFNAFESNRIRLSEAGILYRQSDLKGCKKIGQFAFSGTQYCKDHVR